MKVEVNIVYKSQDKPTDAIAPGKVVTVVGTTWREIVLDPKKTVFVNFFAPCMWIFIIQKKQ